MWHVVAELCALRTFGGVDFSLVFICAQSVSEFLWDRLRASIQFPVMPKRAQYARFSGESHQWWIAYRPHSPLRVQVFHWEFADRFGLEQSPASELRRRHEIRLMAEHPSCARGVVAQRPASPKPQRPARRKVGFSRISCIQNLGTIPNTATCIGRR